MFWNKAKKYDGIDEVIKNIIEQKIAYEKTKKYNATISICLNCTNAFVEEYELSCGDPLTVVCKVKGKLLNTNIPGHLQMINAIQCSSSQWIVKTTKCSDYVRTKEAEELIQLQEEKEI